MTPLRARLASARPGAAAYARTLAQLPADLAGTQARVGQLFVYPVKSLGGLALAEARVERHGLVDPRTGLADRSVLLAATSPGTTPEGEPFDAVGIANRTDPTPSLARLRLEGRTLVIEAPGVPALRVEPDALAPREGPRVRVKLPYDGGPVVEAVREDGPLTEWLRGLLRAHPQRRRFLADDAFAALLPPDHRRAVPERHRLGEDVGTLYGDGAHVLVASSSTLAWMNAALATAGARTIDMAVFRPNVVLDGLPPNAEDLVAEAHVHARDGPLPLRFASLCVRCDATRVDLATGRRPDAQPLAFLARERPPRDDEGNAATFAVNAVVPAAAHGRTIRAGDAVTIARERT